MKFNETDARRISIEWGIGKAQIERWRVAGKIPDMWTRLNFAKPHRLIWYHRFLSCLGGGWLNAEALCRHYNWHKTKLSDVMSYQRNPRKASPRTLYGEEIDAITLDFLAPLQTMVDSVIARARATPADKLYDDALQADLALILQVKVLRPARCRQGFTEQDSYKLRALESGKRKKIGKFENKHVLRDCFLQLEQLQAILNENVPVDSQIITSSGHERINTSPD